MDKILEKFNNNLIDGLDFCKMIYENFEQIQNSVKGAKNMSLHDNYAKKFCEELIPIARYIQQHYNFGRYISVKWMDGSQSYDAELYQRGILIEKGFYPIKIFLEVTCVMHENEHWTWKIAEQHGITYAPEGIELTKKDKLEQKADAPILPKSQCKIFDTNEHINNFALQTINRIQEKNKNPNYPKETILIAICHTFTRYRLDEWRQLVSIIEDKLPPHKFKEIFLLDDAYQYATHLTFKQTEKI